MLGIGFELAGPLKLEREKESFRLRIKSLFDDNYTFNLIMSTIKKGRELSRVTGNGCGPREKQEGKMRGGDRAMIERDENTREVQMFLIFHDEIR